MIISLSLWLQTLVWFGTMMECLPDILWCTILTMRLPLSLRGLSWLFTDVNLPYPKGNELTRILCPCRMLNLFQTWLYIYLFFWYFFDFIVFQYWVILNRCTMRYSPTAQIPYNLRCFPQWISSRIFLCAIDYNEKVVGNFFHRNAVRFADGEESKYSLSYLTIYLWSVWRLWSKCMTFSFSKEWGPTLFWKRKRHAETCSNIMPQNTSLFIILLYFFDFIVLQYTYYLVLFCSNISIIFFVWYSSPLKELGHAVQSSGPHSTSLFPSWEDTSYLESKYGCNPTGVTATLQRRKEVLKLSREHNFIILEGSLLSCFPSSFLMYNLLV